MVIGAVIYEGEPSPWDGLLLLSGFGIVWTDLARHGWSWFRYGQGAATVVKVGLLAVGIVWPPFLVTSLFCALVVGSVVSHAPGSLRNFPLWGAPGPCAVDKGGESGRPGADNVVD